MKEVDALKLVLNAKMDLQTYYNDAVINLRNPEVRCAFTLLREEEGRDIENLQQKIYRLETAPWIIQKMYCGRRR